MTIDEAAAKIAEEVFRTIEHEKRILKSDIVEAAGKVLRSNGGKPLVAAEVQVPVNDSLRQAQQRVQQLISDQRTVMDKAPSEKVITSAEQMQLLRELYNKAALFNYQTELSPEGWDYVYRHWHGGYREV